MLIAGESSAWPGWAPGEQATRPGRGSAAQDPRPSIEQVIRCAVHPGGPGGRILIPSKPKPVISEPGVATTAASGNPAAVVTMKLFGFGALPGGGPAISHPPVSPASNEVVPSPVDTSMSSTNTPSPCDRPVADVRDRHLDRAAGVRRQVDRPLLPAPELPDAAFHAPVVPVGVQVVSSTTSGSSRAAGAARPAGRAALAGLCVVFPLTSGSVVQSSRPRASLDGHVVPLGLGVVRRPERHRRPPAGTSIVRVSRLYETSPIWEYA